MKNVCVYHRIDLDGWMSAAIVKLANRSLNKNMGKSELFHDEGLDFIGYNYGDPMPDLSQYYNVILVDISFPLPEFQRLVKEGKTITWIDHHASALNESEEYAISQGFMGKRSTSYAACELAWMTFFPDKEMPRMVHLLGRYDCFGHKGTKEEKYVLEFQYGARGVIHNMDEAFKYIEHIFNKSEYHFLQRQVDVGSIHESGETIYKYLCEDAKLSYKNGFEMEMGFTFPNPSPSSVTMKDRIPIKFIVINRERFNPINFGIDYHKDGYDGCACFHFDGRMWNFSLYNDNGLVDVSLIAKGYGGGGHKGAAGFRVKDISSIMNLMP